MNTKELFKRFISKGALIYTAGSLFILLFSLMLPENSAAKILSPTPFLFFAVYAYIISLGSVLYSSGAFSSAVARLIHAACYNVGFFCFVLLCRMEFAFTAIFTAVFAIIYTAAVIISGAFKKKSSSVKKSPEKQDKTNKQPLKNKKEKSKTQSTYTSRFS